MSASKKRWLAVSTGALALLTLCGAMAPSLRADSEGQPLLAGAFAAVIALAASFGVGELWARMRRSGDGSAELAALTGALEAMARQGEALPAAAACLERAVEKLTALEAGLAEAHERAAGDMLAVARNAMLDWRNDMKLAIEDAARAARDAVAPLAEQTLERALAAVGAEQSRILEALTRDFDARRAAEASHAERIEERASSLVEQLAGAERERAALQNERVHALIEHIESLALASEQRDRAHAALLAQHVEAAEVRIARQQADQAAALEALAETLRHGEERRAERQAELEQSQQRARAVELAGFRDALTGQASQLAERLGASADLVRECGELVKAGGAELCSVAEMFGQAVDRQSESAGAWLESLGSVEAAVEHAGRGAAVEALREQLAATEELFARQLQFERELYEQLRALRHGGAPDDEAGSLSDEVGEPGDVG